MPNQYTGPLLEPPAHVLRIYELRATGLTTGQIAYKLNKTTAQVTTLIAYWRKRGFGT